MAAARCHSGKARIPGAAINIQVHVIKRWLQRRNDCYSTELYDHSTTYDKN